MTAGTITILITATTLLIAIGLIAFGITRIYANGDVIHDRVEAYAVLPGTKRQAPRIRRRRARLSSLRYQINTVLSSLDSDRVSLDLLRANWRITVTEYILIRFGGTALAFLLGWLISGTTLPGVGLAAITYLVPGLLIQRRINKRQLAFEKQLVDILVLITGSVRAGFSLLQAIELVVREMEPPASEEFKRVVQEASLGVTVPQALRNLSSRMENDDLDLVVTSIEIQYQVGGNLATMLEAVSETIRERIRLFGEVRVITTQQRYTGYLLSVLPFIIGAMIFIMNPTYMRKLFEPGGIICIPIGAVLGIIAGHFTIKRIANIEI
jgi:tight adherence protein B